MTALAPAPFAQALARAASAVGGVPATYTPPAGLPLACTVVLRRDLQPSPGGLTADPVTVADFLAADIPAPQAGATLAIGAATYRVDGLIDDDGAVVTVAVRAL